MTVSVLLPTTGRPEMAERCVRGLRDTAEVEIVCAVDADPQSATLLAPLVDKLLVAPHFRGCSRAWNDCLAEASGDLFVLAADDLVWGDGWLEAAQAKMAEFEDGWGLVGFNDGHWGAELSTHYLMSRRFIVEVLGGVVAWECYSHSFNDTEANERAKRAGRYAWAEDAHVGHEHWLFGDRSKDTTDTRNLGAHAESERTYKDRAAAGFPNDQEPVLDAY